MIRLKKGLASRYWENLLLGLIGGQFQDSINGVVLSIRLNEDILSIWNPSSSNGVVNLRIRDTMKHLLNLPESAVLEYKEHNHSLRDKSSFRNTDIFL
jgi:translation initiation factor 4E